MNENFTNIDFAENSEEMLQEMIVKQLKNIAIELFPNIELPYFYNKETKQFEISFLTSEQNQKVWDFFPPKITSPPSSKSSKAS